ncbi:MAG: hypothetical protein KDA20_04260 [Phycisphaerales bacterium]|nr:hypothetical protein [Phycisphaerales bacterium]
MSRLQLPNLPALGWLALTSVVVMAIVSLMQVAGLAAVALAGSPAIAETVASDGFATFDAALTRDAQRIDNRSPFFVPPRPAPKVVERPKVEVTPVERPKPAEAPPARYGGPSIIAMMGDSVWLDTGSRVHVGEEADGVQVIETHVPWGARVTWRGKEYDVTLFERTTDQFLTGGQPAAGEAGSDATMSEDDSNDAEDERDEADESADDLSEDDEDGDA